MRVYRNGVLEGWLEDAVEPTTEQHLEIVRTQAKVTDRTLKPPKEVTVNITLQCVIINWTDNSPRTRVWRLLGEVPPGLRFRQTLNLPGVDHIMAANP